MSEIQSIAISDAPAAKGPYSAAVRAGDFIYVSGQGPIDPSNNEFAFGTIQHETQLVLENIRRILAGCGASPKDVVKCSVFLANAEDFSAMNAVYAEFFGDHKPVRTTVAATLVEPNMKVEIDCVAYLPLTG
jgi:2-iminobutanoate/2-iminopropanoate deaminase